MTVQRLSIAPDPTAFSSAVLPQASALIISHHILPGLAVAALHRGDVCTERYMCTEVPMGRKAKIVHITVTLQKRM